MDPPHDPPHDSPYPPYLIFEYAAPSDFLDRHFVYIHNNYFVDESHTYSNGIEIATNTKHNLLQSAILYNTMLYLPPIHEDPLMFTDLCDTDPAIENRYKFILPHGSEHAYTWSAQMCIDGEVQYEHNIQLYNTTHEYIKNTIKIMLYALTETCG